jgi:hypothetical protein
VNGERRKDRSLSRSPHNAALVLPLLLVVGFALGALTGRWWALLAPAAFAVYVTVESEVEVPSWFLGLGYGLIGGLAVVGGVLLRRFANRNAKPS